MRFEPVEPPREFEVGRRRGTLRHVGDAFLEDDEVLTLRTESGTELDLTRKALAVGVPRDGERANRMYLLLVEPEHEQDFHAYLAAEEMEVVAWLDSDEAVARAAATLRTTSA